MMILKTMTITNKKTKNMSYKARLFLLATATTCLFSLPHAQAASIKASGLNTQIASTSITQIAVEAHDLEKAQKFVNNVAAEGIGFLSDSTLTQDQRITEFKKLLQNSFDMKTIGIFTLGKYWRQATPEQKKEYLSLFEKMIIDVYASRFGEYSGEELVVTNARAEGKRDILVNSEVQAQNGQAIKVDWRLRDRKGSFKVIDVIVEGVSMSVTQRSDFSSVIQRGGGNIEVLLKHLRGE